jgi:hypothetical protein
MTLLKVKEKTLLDLQLSIQEQKLPRISFLPQLNCKMNRDKLS